MRNLVNRPMNPLCTPLSLRGSEQSGALPIEPPYEQPGGGGNKLFNRLRTAYGLRHRFRIDGKSRAAGVLSGVISIYDRIHNAARIIL